MVILLHSLNLYKISISVHNYSKTCCTQLLSVLRTEYNRRTRADNDRHNSIAIQNNGGLWLKNFRSLFLSHAAIC